MLICLSGAAVAVQAAENTMPVIDGQWWQVAGNPMDHEYATETQQPVDFAVWQAADGTWQLWSCIRGTSIGGRSRLFYRWEGEELTDSNWEPMGIAMEADVSLAKRWEACRRHTW